MTACIRRREFITLIGGAAAWWPLAARAQQPTRPFRIGVLAFGQDPASPLFDAFRDEMRNLGHIEGQTYVLEFRSARGDADRTQSFAAADVADLSAGAARTWLHRGRDRQL
jgi:putative ABC transport system substrate-binding protein